MGRSNLLKDKNKKTNLGYTSCCAKCIVYVATSLVNNDYIIYYVYTPVQSVNCCDRLGRCFRFVMLVLLCFSVGTVSR